MRALATPVAAVIVAALMTALAAWEHNFSGWRPFYLGYAALCILIPIAAATVKLGWAPLKISGWIVIVAAPFVLQAVAGGFVAGAYPAALAALGVAPEAMSEPYYNIGAALPLTISRYAAHWNLTPEAMLLAYVGFIALWAGIGEEFFYRGYVHEALGRWGVVTAVLIGNLFFAGRHAVQLIGPDYPVGAAIAWLGMTFILGLAFTFIYMRWRSIWPAAIVHTAFNAIPYSGMLIASAQAP